MKVGDRVTVEDYANPGRRYPGAGTVIERAWKAPAGLIWKVRHDDGLENWYPDKDVAPLLMGTVPAPLHPR